MLTLAPIDQSPIMKIFQLWVILPFQHQLFRTFGHQTFFVWFSVVLTFYLVSIGRQRNGVFKLTFCLEISTRWYYVLVENFALAKPDFSQLKNFLGGGTPPPPLERDTEKILEAINSNTDLPCAVDSESAEARNADIVRESMHLAGLDSEESDSEYFEWVSNL